MGGGGRTEETVSLGNGLKYPLSLQVRVCVVASQALRMLTNIAAFWAGFWRWKQVGKCPFLTTNWSLKNEPRREEKQN